MSAASVRASLFPPSFPEGTDEVTLRCHPHPDVVVALADDASSNMCQNAGVFGTPEEIDLGTWHRQVVRTSVVEKFCQVRAPLVTDRVPFPLCE